MNQALLLIDLQNDYFPGGACQLEGADAALANAAQLLAAARQNGTPVIHIRHISLRPGAGFFLPGTRGVEIHQGVAPVAGEAVIDKHFPNSFRDTPLRETRQTRPGNDANQEGQGLALRHEGAHRR